MNRVQIAGMVLAISFAFGCKPKVAEVSPPPTEAQSPAQVYEAETDEAGAECPAEL